MVKDIVLNNVRNLRNKEGVTQEQLAERIGVTRQTIIAIEKGSYTPSVALALGIAAFFGIPLESIFFIKP